MALSYRTFSLVYLLRNTLCLRRRHPHRLVSLAPSNLRPRTFSINHLLIDYASGVVIRITYGDPNGGNKDSRDCARSAVKSDGFCAAKRIPLIKPLALRVLQHPLTPANMVC